MFQKVGDWLSDKSERFIRGEAGEAGSYYASNEAEQAYGKLRQEPVEEMADMKEMDFDPGHKQALDPFERAGKDYGGRVPYRSQRDLAAEQQRQMREEPPQGFQAQPAPPQGFGSPAYAGPPPQGRPQQSMGYASPAQAPQQAPQPQSNVVPFPGMQRGPDGGVYAHTEYIVLLRSRNECRNVIEYIKASASVFLNMEFIASDSERQRCVDMLSGAAYTLGCALNKISPRGIYLISSPSVYVVVDPALQKVATTPEAGGFARQSYESTGYGSAQRQSAGYAGGGQTSAYAKPVSAPEPQGSRFAAQAQPAGFVAQGTQRRPPVTFGGVMAGNGTGAYSPATAFRSDDASTGRFVGQGYRQ